MRSEVLQFAILLRFGRHTCAEVRQLKPLSYTDILNRIFFLVLKVYILSQLNDTLKSKRLVFFKKIPEFIDDIYLIDSEIKKKI